MKKLTLVVVLVLSCILVLPVSAQKLEYNGFGVHGNLVFPENHNTGFGVGGSVNMGELSDNIYLVPFADFWTASWEAFDDGSSTDIAIGADVHYFLDRKPQGVYFGGGLSLNFISFSYDFRGITGYDPITFQPIYGTETFDDSETKIGFHPLAGYVFDLSGTEAFVEAKYLLISDWNTFMISFGALFGK